MYVETTKLYEWRILQILPFGEFMTGEQMKRFYVSMVHNLSNCGYI